MNASPDGSAVVKDRRRSSPSLLVAPRCDFCDDVVDIRFTTGKEYATGMIDGAPPCKSCGSSRQAEFNGEICLHFPGGVESLDKPLVWMFPKVVVCLDCGLAQFNFPEAKLKPFQENLASSGVKAAS